MKNLISFGGFTLKLIYPLIMGTSHIIISVAYRLFTIKKIDIIFICFAVDFIRNITVKFIRGDNETTIFFEVFVKNISIPVISLLTIFILHYKYYRHYLIGYLITAFGLVLDPTFDLIQKGISMNKIFLLSLLTFIYLTSSLLEVLEKYLMDVIFLNPYLIISSEGIFVIVIISGLIPLFHIITIDGVPIENLTECFALLSKYQIYKIGLIIYFIGVFIYNILRLLTNQRSSPVHLIMADCFSTLLSLLLQMSVPYFNEGKKIETGMIVIGIGYVFIFSELMIFLEFVVVNKWGMNKNTTFNIAQRANEETNDLHKDSLDGSLCGPIEDMVDEKDEDGDIY